MSQQRQDPPAPPPGGPPEQGYPEYRDYYAQPQEGDLDLMRYVEILRRHWKLAAALCLLVTAGFVVRYFMTPPIYQATAVVQIERRDLGQMAGLQGRSWFESFTSLEYFYQTQYRLLSSRGLGERVARDLRLHEDPKFNPRAAAGGGDGAATLEDDYAAIARIGARLANNLEVRPIRNTELVHLIYRSGSPELAARIANAYAETYIDWDMDQRTATAGQASTFLASQVETLRREIRERETRLEQLGRTTEVFTLDTAANPILRRLEQLNADFVSAVSDRINKEARLNELTGSPAETVAGPLSDGLVGQLRRELLQMEREYATKLNTYRPEWPPMQDLQADIERMRANLDEVVEETVAKARQSARAEYQTALRRERSLQQELDRVRAEAMDMSAGAIEFNNLKVEIEARRALLDDLMRRQSETEVATRLRDTGQSNVRLVDRATVPGRPSHPRLRRELGLGLFLGLLLGIGVVGLIEFMDRTIKTPEQMEKALFVPTLGIIPDLEDQGAYGRYGAYSSHGRRGGKREPAKLDGRVRRISVSPLEVELSPHENPRLGITEAYRSLRTALLLSSAKQVKTVAVISAGPLEGKSATATNLAVVLAQSGRRVLLIDGDLRKPRLHEIFGLTNRLGVVNFLTGSASFEDIVQPTDIERLYVVGSGPYPPNPSELLGSERMVELMQLAKSQFDTVVVDTPPVLAVTDAVLIGAVTDGTIVIVRAGKVNREDAKAVGEKLRLAGVRVLGAVLNRLPSTDRRYSRRYAYYESYVTSDRSADSAA